MTKLLAKYCKGNANTTSIECFIRYLKNYIRNIESERFISDETFTKYIGNSVLSIDQMFSKYIGNYFRALVLNFCTS
jgi:hypothetical protein